MFKALFNSKSGEEQNVNNEPEKDGLLVAEKMTSTASTSPRRKSPTRPKISNDTTDSELKRLLQQYKSGNLFQTACSFEKLDAVRVEQERLARSHYLVDAALLRQNATSSEMASSDYEDERERSRKNMKHLMRQLEELGEAIDSLHVESIDVDRYKL